MGQPATLLTNVRVFATYPHDCSYLEGEQATTLFVDPATPVDTRLYSQLSAIGFRRSGPHLYRPHCATCSACLPARIPVADFNPTRSQRKLINRNADLEVDEIDCIDDEEYFALYVDYINSRHRDGDMYPPGREQYASFLTREWGTTRYVTFRESGRLIGVAVVDYLDNGLAAIYTFYDASEALSKRSIGSYAVLWQIARADELGLPAVYLGYYIKDCKKMNYKTRFRPIELLSHGQWVRLE